jgi:hypothetical protein
MSVGQFPGSWRLGLLTKETSIRIRVCKLSANKNIRAYRKIKSMWRLLSRIAALEDMFCNSSEMNFLIEAGSRSVSYERRKGQADFSHSYAAYVQTSTIITSSVRSTTDCISETVGDSSIRRRSEDSAVTRELDGSSPA